MGGGKTAGADALFNEKDHSASMRDSARRSKLTLGPGNRSETNDIDGALDTPALPHSTESPDSEVDEQDDTSHEQSEDENEMTASQADSLVDQVELQPYQAGKNMTFRRFPMYQRPLTYFCADTADDASESISPEAIKELHSQLQQQGPAQFLEETLYSGKFPPTTLGVAFGLDPNFHEIFGDAGFRRLLMTAIVRVCNKRPKLRHINTVDDVVQLLRNSRKIIVITGAGISTSLGIPDFRSKNTGFYDKIRAVGYSEPEEVFDIRAFDEDPSVFYSLAGDLLPDVTRFSLTHAFIKLLEDRGRLQTNYTQNIDDLEAGAAAISRQKLVQCHGSFGTATCRKCSSSVKGTEIFGDLRAKRVAICKQGATKCTEIQRLSRTLQPVRKARRSVGSYADDDDDDDILSVGVMKPDITFFGEQLPATFFDRLRDVDVHVADLVIVIGTSLKVAPVSEMPNLLPHHVPHVYINKERIQHVNFDVQLLGNCDEVVAELCRRAGWPISHESWNIWGPAIIGRDGEEEHIWRFGMDDN